MIVKQNMTTEAEIICQKSISMLDDKYELRMAQEHGVKVEVSPTSNVVPMLSHVRVSAESVETTRYESVGTGFPFKFYFFGFLFCFVLVFESIFFNSLLGFCFVLFLFGEKLVIGVLVGLESVGVFRFFFSFLWIIVH